MHPRESKAVKSAWCRGSDRSGVSGRSHPPGQGLLAPVANTSTEANGAVTRGNDHSTTVTMVAHCMHDRTRAHKMLLLLLSMSSAPVGALEHESSAATDASVVAPARCNGTVRYNGICEPLDFPPRMNCETQPSICSIVSRHFWPQTGAALHATVVMPVLGHWKLIMAAHGRCCWTFLAIACACLIVACNC